MLTRETIQMIRVDTRKEDSLRQNSPSRARTYNLAVNSRSLYLLSYRGIASAHIIGLVANDDY